MRRGSKVSAMINRGPVKFLWTCVCLIAAVALAPNAIAQCAKATVNVNGKVEHIPSGVYANVIVVLKTSKGDFSKASKLIGESFNLDVSFDTLKSWSPLWGHRCSNVPKLVDITVQHANAVLAEKKLRFIDAFQSREPLRYTLKSPVTLDASPKSKRDSP